jgi:hypothetical protein
MANLTEIENIPENFKCPITLSIMNDPIVVVPCGHSFEKYSLEQYQSLNHNPKCPNCRADIENTAPNYSLKNAIQEWLEGKSNDDKVSSESTDAMLKQSSTQIYVEQIENTIKLAYDDLFTKRQPVNLIFVLDVSYSMDTLIKSLNDEKNEEHGFSRLDLVKFVTKTIIHLLNKEDRISIILYSDDVQELVSISNGQMNETNKKRINNYIDNIKSNGCTRMWRGISEAFRSVKFNENLNRYNSNIILLTDGCPTEGETARGILPTLESYIRKKGIVCPVHSFLFGYDGNPKLMEKISELTSGTFGFIPDASMMSTFIINKITCILNTCVNVIEFEYSYSCDDEKLLESLAIFKDYTIGVKTSEKKFLVPLGSLQYDLAKSFNFDINDEFFKLTNVYCDGIEQNITSVSESKIYGTSSKLCIKCRFEFVDTLNKLISNLNQVLNFGRDLDVPRFIIASKINEFTELIDDVNSGSDAEYIKNLINELENQISIGFSNVHHLKVWVLPYLISLRNAHLNQYCSDFKNHSIKMYKGLMFEKLKDELSDIFDTLPPPKASRRNERPTSHYRSLSLGKVAERFTRPAHALTSMSVYNNPNYGGCFTGDCQIETKNGLKLVSELEPKDIVRTPEGFSNVNHIVVTKYPESTFFKLRALSNNSNDEAFITEWHPIRINGEWEFPINKLDCVIVNNLNLVYNLILEEHHVVYLNGVEVVTLGHGFKGDVIEHDFFGNMNKIKEYYVDKSIDGFIELSHNQTTRNEKGLVNGLI